ncbi:MAG: SlyX family protein [Beijerinckiaceae bacterium]
MQERPGASVEDLEIRIAHQEKTLADLNEIVTNQWRRIDLLERQVREMREELRNFSPPRDGEEPPPPHY